MPYLIKNVKNSEPRKITCGIMRNLTAKKDFSDMDFCHVTISDETQEHYHDKLTECYYVLKGSIAVRLDDKTENLEKGSLILIHPRTKHKARKTSEEDAEILVICCPPWSKEDEILTKNN
ncbi:cupin domain-containing protein [bacterium]|nr:MAG: cupin domain-containing protein [bacterium]